MESTRVSQKTRVEDWEKEKETTWEREGDLITYPQASRSTANLQTWLASIGSVLTLDIGHTRRRLTIWHSMVKSTCCEHLPRPNPHAKGRVFEVLGARPSAGGDNISLLGSLLRLLLGQLVNQYLVDQLPHEVAQPYTHFPSKLAPHLKPPWWNQFSPWPIAKTFLSTLIR